jgi:thymidine kinase
MKTNPEFIIFTGPMFGGKTTRMIASLERAKYRKKKIILFKPEIDGRYSQNKVKTHTGASWNAINVINGQSILEQANGSDIVAVDEAFMIPGCADALITLFRRGKSIYVSSIQLSSAGEPFEEMMKLFPWATKIEVCPAVCPITGEDAYYTIAKTEVDLIQVGGSEIYEPRSYNESNIPLNTNI